MADYVLLSSPPSVQVQSPTAVVATNRCTIATIPTGVQATYEVPEQAFQTQAGVDLLDTLAQGIESLVAGHHVTGGTPAQDFDNNNLLADFVDLIVTLDRSSQNAPPLTAIARVPVNSFFLAETGIGGLSIPGPGGTPADIVDATYANLQRLAGG